MGVNHVRMDGQIVPALKDAGLTPQPCSVHSAYGGLWRWFSCLATR
jgi:hypothetical protein